LARISKKSADEQTTWESKIHRAKKVRENWKALFKTELAYDYFEGKQKDTGYADADWITINNIYAHVKAQLPALYSADPYFYVKVDRAFTADPNEIIIMEKKARIRQAMLNYLKFELDLKTKMRLCIFDALFRYGVAKVHYTADEKSNPNFGNAIYSDDGETPLVDESSGEPIYEPEYIPVNGRYNVTRIHPDDFIWDEDSGTLPDDWKWVAQRIRMTLDDAKKYKNYNKAALKKLEGKGQNTTDEEQARTERKKGGDIAGPSERGDRKKVSEKEPEVLSFWEIYRIKEGTYLTIAENGELPVMDETPVPVGIETHPFAILRFTFRDDSPYPVPPLSQGIDLAKEYNRARSDIQKHRKRFNRKYEVAKNYIGDNPDVISKLESGDDGTVIPVNQVGGINVIQEAQLDPMRYNELQYLRQEMIQVLGGSSEESRGIAGAETATQAGILDKRLEMREGDAMSMVVDFVTSIARKLDQLIQAHITKDEAVRVSGPQGEYWELVKTNDYESINGEFGYSVNVGATIPSLPHVERASWLSFLSIAFQNPAMLVSKRLFKKIAELHHVEDEALLEEVYAIGNKMISGQIPVGGQQGSQPNISESRPVSATGGMAGGSSSMMLPGAGNIK